uniref:CASP-like protein n=1 Tax=Kalanchoe fedtschenkoi TaxID=63787 RepID=A0A7N0SWW8_KALFE
MDVKRMQLVLRAVAVLVLVLTACLVGLDSQTKLVFGILEKKATFRDLDALFVLVHVVSVAAGYNLVQLGQEIATRNRSEGRSSSSSFYLYLNWVCFFFDQVAVYLVFAANCAALEASMLAVTGAERLQWMKLCDTFTRFCFQMGGGLVCGFIACFVMAAISSYVSFKVNLSKLT